MNLMTATTTRKSPGRPRVAPVTTMVSMLVPSDWHDSMCREAIARDVPVAVVYREAIRYSRLKRGDIL